MELVTEALHGRLPAGWRVRIQSAIATADSEPDLAVVRGTIRDNLGHHPGPADLALVVEVADSTLAVDRDLNGNPQGRNFPNRSGIDPQGTQPSAD